MSNLFRWDCAYGDEACNSLPIHCKICNEKFCERHMAHNHKPCPRCINCHLNAAKTGGHNTKYYDLCDSCIWNK